jgi:hypothetical protein
MGEQAIKQVGQITHYFHKINVGIIELSLPLVIGDCILVKGPTTDFEQTVSSMQIERKNIAHAEAGQSIGLKLVQQAKEQDVIYKKI